MNRIKVLAKNEKCANSPDITWRVGTFNASYSALERLLGKPTYSEKSADQTVSKQWSILFNDEFFTIYDYNYPSGWAKNETIRWSIGSNGKNPEELLSFLSRCVNQK